MNAPSSDNYIMRGNKGKRKSITNVDCLLREAHQFLKINDDSNESSSMSDAVLDDGRRRSSRRLSRFVSTTTTVTSTVSESFFELPGYGNSLETTTLMTCSKTSALTSVQKDELLEDELDFTNISSKKRRPRRTARRCKKSTANIEDLNTTMPSGFFHEAIDSDEETTALRDPGAAPECAEMIETSSAEKISNLAEDELTALYTNQNYVEPENRGLETIEELLEEEISSDESPVKSKKARASKNSKPKKTKQPWRFIPHLVLDLPEIWWQELPLPLQTKCRKKARESGYRPSSKKRLNEAEKRVHSTLEEVDRYLECTTSAVTVDSYSLSARQSTDSRPVVDDVSPGFQNDTLGFGSLQVFLPNNSASSSSSSSPSD